MHASENPRLILILDGLSMSFQWLEIIQTDLYETCLKINNDQTQIPHAIWRCWSFIDAVHRIREISMCIPGLSKKDNVLLEFLENTKHASHFRNYIQHLREELAKPDMIPNPVWGAISWADKNVKTKSYTAVIGAQVGVMSYPGMILDTVAKMFVSRVAIADSSISFNFDPAYAACINYRDYIMPWLLSTYKKEVKFVEKLQIFEYECHIGTTEELNRIKEELSQKQK